jgi:signal transduction histidine kinase
MRGRAAGGADAGTPRPLPGARPGGASLSDQLEALDAATRAIAGVLDLETVLQLIADTVRQLVRAEYAALGVVDTGGRIERFITSGIGTRERERIGAPPRGHGLLGLIIREGRSYRIASIVGHPDSYGFPPNHPAMSSFLGVPVSVGGRAIGNLYLTNKLGAAEFSEADQRLTERFAIHAAIAVERARLHAEVRRLALVDERDRIGKDLHDGIIQAIYGVVLALEDVPELMDSDRSEAASRIDRAIDRLNVVTRDIRRFIVGLAADETGGSDLAAGLAGLVEELRAAAAVDVELDVTSAQGAEDLDARGVGELLQLAREALSNIARHSGASTARISVASEGTSLSLEIADNGRGFDPSEPRSAGHLGLRNMARRAAALGATLAIDSKAGRGTRIVVTMPVGPFEEQTD